MIMLTGASGFVGNAVLKRLMNAGQQVSAAGRKAVAEVPFVKVDLTEVEDIGTTLEHINTIIHCAARVHVMTDTAKDPLASYRQVNTEGTLALAKQAADAGVKHFIFISTIKVNGEETKHGKRFSSSDQPNPTDPYSISKYEAEQALFEIAKFSNMQVTVIRPPLVYGPGVGANFEKLFASVKKGIPLPLGGVKNKRSLVALDNLVSLIVTCVHNTNAYGKIFLVSDDHDVSTRELILQMHKVLQKKSKLLFLPPIILYAIGVLTGKSMQIKRLCGTLQVNVEPTKQALGWEPEITMYEQLLKMIEHDSLS